MTDEQQDEIEVEVIHNEHRLDAEEERQWADWSEYAAIGGTDPVRYLAGRRPAYTVRDGHYEETPRVRQAPRALARDDA